MASKGPFQPKAFYDSMILCSSFRRTFELSACLLEYVALASRYLRMTEVSEIQA